MEELVEDKFVSHFLRDEILTFSKVSYHIQLLLLFFWINFICTSSSILFLWRWLISLFELFLAFILLHVHQILERIDVLSTWSIAIRRLQTVIVSFFYLFFATTLVSFNISEWVLQFLDMLHEPADIWYCWLFSICSSSWFTRCTEPCNLSGTCSEELEFADNVECLVTKLISFSSLCYIVVVVDESIICTLQLQVIILHLLHILAKIRNKIILVFGPIYHYLSVGLLSCRSGRGSFLFLFLASLSLLDTAINEVNLLLSFHLLLVEDLLDRVHGAHLLVQVN